MLRFAKMFYIYNLEDNVSIQIVKTVKTFANDLTPDCRYFSLQGLPLYSVLQLHLPRGNRASYLSGFSAFCTRQALGSNAGRTPATMSAKSLASVYLQSVYGRENMRGIKLTETNARGETDMNTTGIRLTETNARGETDMNTTGIRLTETNASGETDMKTSDAFLTVLRSPAVAARQRLGYVYHSFLS
jgi:hypothetical protein